MRGSLRFLRGIALLLLAGCASGKIEGRDAGLPPSDTGAAGCASDIDCNDEVACTTDTCDVATGACTNAADDSLCLRTERCIAEQGCELRPPCETDDDCDDADFCNGQETCDQVNGCQAGSAPSCDDGVGCTTDSCAAGACVNEATDSLCSNGIVCDGMETCDSDNAAADANGCVAGSPPVCDDGVACTIDGCSEGAGGCEHAGDAGACDDGVFCNGDEVCNVTSGCEAGAPAVCDDGLSCTVDRCDASADACAFDPDSARCADGAVCNGSERCDPANATTTSGCAAGTPVSCDDGMACTTDRCREPGGSCEHLGSDADGDGFIAAGCAGGNDCDDLSPAVHPGVAEICDGVDNDCSGRADDGGGMECALGSLPAACTTGCSTAGARTCNSSCRLTPCVAATETCNACDDDGNGTADDGFPCRRGTTGACTTACGTAGTQACATDCSGFGVCAAASESCNDCDDNRDGSIDEGFTCRRGVTRGCSTACGTIGSQTCALDCSGFGACIATEACNGCDDDADGVADDGFTCRQGQSVACTTACSTPGTQQCNSTCSAFGTCRATGETCGNGCDDDGNGTIDDGCGRPNDRCTGATAISGNTGTLNDVIDAATRTVTDCGSGPEVWYRFTITSRKIVYFDTFGSSFDTEISLRTSCTGAAAQCEDDDCGGRQDQLVRVLDAGTYFVAVHAFSSSVTTGAITLNWQMTSAGNGTFTRITTNGAYGGTTSGTGTLASSCGGSGPEDGFFFTLCPATSRTVTADTCTGTAFDTVLSLRSANDVQIICNDDSCGTQSSLSGAATGPGVFLILMDGFGGQAGAYSVTVGGL